MKNICDLRYIIYYFIRIQYIYLLNNSKGINLLSLSFCDIHFHFRSMYKSKLALQVIWNEVFSSGPASSNSISKPFNMSEIYFSISLTAMQYTMQYNLLVQENAIIL